MQAFSGWLSRTGGTGPIRLTVDSTEPRLQRALCNECLRREVAVCLGCRVASCDNCLGNDNCCTWARRHEECLLVDDQIPRWTLLPLWVISVMAPRLSY